MRHPRRQYAAGTDNAIRPKEVEQQRDILLTFRDTSRILQHGDRRG